MKQKQLVAQENINITKIRRRIENCPSNVELSQFHKRLVELFENMNLKAEEQKRFYNLFNTVHETKKLFAQEGKYLDQIVTHYKSC